MSNHHGPMDADPRAGSAGSPPDPGRVELALVRSFQDALLPGDLPVVPALDLAASYLLATDERSAGGDWFDAVLRPDGAVALVVGDVVGHGLAASATMGQLRAVLHDRLLGRESLVDAMTALDRFALVRPESQAATVCVVVLDPETGEIEYCTAGHPPPLVVSGAGEARYLLPSGARPLATRGGLPVARDRLEPDELVLLYTDGLIERPGTTPAQSTVDLSREASDAALDHGLPGASAPTAERVSQRTLERLVQDSGYLDDITLMVAQRVPRIAPLEVRLPAEPASVPRARRDARRWLGALDVRAVDELAVEHAVGELVTNVVDHAYDDDAGPVMVDADVDPTGHVVFTVSDRGHWRAGTRSAGRGRGLALVRGLVDALELRHEGRGTTATFRHRLGRSALMLSAAGGGQQQAGPHSTFRAQLDGDRLVVSGELDAVNADSLRVALLRASRGGTAELSVDLSAVTYLGSAGILVLHEATGRKGAILVLHAPPGSVAQQALEVAQVPYSNRRG